jgi:hypothetical protein
MLSCYVVSLHKGHLQQMFHLSMYLKHHKRSKMVLDDTKPVFDEISLRVCDWLEFYSDAEEAIPRTGSAWKLCCESSEVCSRSSSETFFRT